MSTWTAVENRERNRISIDADQTDQSNGVRGAYLRKDFGWTFHIQLIQISSEISRLLFNIALENVMRLVGLNSSSTIFTMW